MDNLNIYNANSQISKTLMEKEKKFAKNRAEFLAEADRKMREETSGKIAKEKALAESAARFAISSTVAKSKARTQSLNEEIDHTNRASIVGMASHITNIVCESLLLDEGELSNIYPEYKEDINNIVKGLLENGDLAEEVFNPVSIALMESVSNKMPSVKEGKYLTEEELRTIITDELPTNVTAKIKDLTGNISSKVASLIEKEEVNAKEIEKDVKAANAANKEKEAAANAPVEEDEGVVAEEDRVPEEEVPAEGEEEAVEELPAESAVTSPISKTLKIMPDGTISLKINEAADSGLIKQARMADGYAWTKRGQYDEEMMIARATGLIKSTLGPSIATVLLAGSIVGLPAALVTSIQTWLRRERNTDTLNSESYKELRDFISKDEKIRSIMKKINAELLDGNPDKKVLKGYKAEFTDRVKELKADYKQSKLSEGFDFLLESIAKDEYLAADSILVKETPRSELIETLAINEAMNQINAGKEYNRDLCLSKAIIMATITETFNALGLMEVNDKKYAEMISEAGGIPGASKKASTVVAMPKAKSKKKLADENKNKTVRPAVSKSGNLSESILVSQYKPRLNTADPNSMAERLRQKRLLQEQERQNQTENLSE